MVLSVLAVPDTWRFIIWGLYRHLRNDSPAVGRIRKDGDHGQECLFDQSNPPAAPQPCKQLFSFLPC